MTDKRVQESRRRLLKILAATGGAVAASTVLPGRWLKPVVEMGVLPAHAQLSDQPILIRDLSLLLTGDEGMQPKAAVSSASLEGQFLWEALCDLTAASYLWVESEQCGTLLKKNKWGDGWKTGMVTKKGNTYHGDAFFFTGICSYNQTGEISVQVMGCGGESNTLKGTVTNAS